MTLGSDTAETIDCVVKEVICKNAAGEVIGKNS